MTYDQIAERFHDAALDGDDDAAWDEQEAREDGWDDPAELSDEDEPEDPDSE